MHHVLRGAFAGHLARRGSLGEAPPPPHPPLLSLILSRCAMIGGYTLRGSLGEAREPPPLLCGAKCSSVVNLLARLARPGAGAGEGRRRARGRRGRETQRRPLVGEGPQVQIRVIYPSHYIRVAPPQFPPAQGEGRGGRGHGGRASRPWDVTVSKPLSESLCIRAPRPSSLVGPRRRAVAGRAAGPRGVRCAGSAEPDEDGRRRQRAAAKGQECWRVG